MSVFHKLTENVSFCFAGQSLHITSACLYKKSQVILTHTPKQQTAASMHRVPLQTENLSGSQRTQDTQRALALTLHLHVAQLRCAALQSSAPLH